MNRYPRWKGIALLLILLLLAGCAAGPASSGRPAAAAGSSASPAASSASAENTSESAASSEASPALVAWDADGALVIPPEMFDPTGAEALPEDRLPDLFGVGAATALSADPLPYLLSEEQLPTADFASPAAADPAYLLRCAVSYAYLAAQLLPAPYLPEPIPLAERQRIALQLAEAGEQVDGIYSRAELDVTAKTLFGDDFVWPVDPVQIDAEEGQWNLAVRYLPEADAFVFTFRQRDALLFDLPLLVAVEGSGTDGVWEVTAAPLQPVLLGDGLRGCMLDYRGQMIYYSARYAAIFKAALLETADCYRLTLTFQPSDGRAALTSLHRLTDAERAAWAEQLAEMPSAAS